MPPPAILEFQGDLPLWEPCTRQQAVQWGTSPENNPRAALRAAACYALLAEGGAEATLGLKDARQGRRLAEAVAANRPGSGLAHYLTAYLTGLEAERDTLRALGLVPLIEREALLAAELSPEVDHGGPDRMLGELYLRAPPFPMSVGDPQRAILHFRRALARAPGFADNRLGLVEALLEGEEAAQACRELVLLFASLPPAEADGTAWQRSLSLLDRLCSRQAKQ